MRDDTTRSRSAAADRPHDDASPAPETLFDEGALSEAAREAVRSPADPRLDAVLARMGLTDAPEARPASTTAETAEPPTPPTRREPAAAVATLADVTPDPALEARQAALASEVDRLRALVATQETTAAQLRDRIGQLQLLAGGGLAVGILALVLALVR
jgi:hypothetical protein